MSLLVEAIAIIAFAAAGTRFLREAESTAEMRRVLSNASALLAKLISCPHCLSFWLSLVCALVLLTARGVSFHTLGYFFELGFYTFAGWRGAYYVNRGLDRRREVRAAEPDRSCAVCGKPCTEDFLERRDQHFCSQACWFTSLRNRPIPRDRLVGPSGELTRLEVYPASFGDITCSEARQRLDADDECVYIDVRSVPEFRNGHPPGAVNVPLLRREPLAMVANPDFLSVVEAHFPRDTRLLVGCQTGSRSVRAAEALVGAGFTQVTNVRGGYAGTRTLAGEVVDRGWLELGLPVDYGDPETGSYAELSGWGGNRAFRRRNAPLRQNPYD